MCLLDAQVHARATSMHGWKKAGCYDANTTSKMWNCKHQQNLEILCLLHLIEHKLRSTSGQAVLGLSTCLMQMFDLDTLWAIGHCTCQLGDIDMTAAPLNAPHPCVVYQVGHETHNLQPVSTHQWIWQHLGCIMYVRDLKLRGSPYLYAHSNPLFSMSALVRQERAHTTQEQV